MKHQEKMILVVHAVQGYFAYRMWCYVQPRLPGSLMYFPLVNFSSSFFIMVATLISDDGRQVVFFINSVLSRSKIFATKVGMTRNELIKLNND